MEMLNRATDGAALFKDMMHKVEAGTAPAEPADPEIAAWNAAVDRAKAEKVKRKIEAGHEAMRVELAKVAAR